jgi:hypothetical protein
LIERTILIDTREKQPLLFPELIGARQPIRLRTENRKLIHGDYAVMGPQGDRLDHVAVVERKKTWGELCVSLPRFRARYRCTVRYLLLIEETVPLSIAVPGPAMLRLSVDRAIEDVINTLVEMNVSLALCGTTRSARTRRKVGQIAAQWLIAQTMSYWEDLA